MSEDPSNTNGGNMSEVRFVDHTVLRDLKPYSPTIHRLLQHLETKGLGFVPRFLGLDTSFEMLSFMQGQTAEHYPFVIGLEAQERTIRSAAKMLRTLHDATLDFVQAPEDLWFLSYPGSLKKEVICHNDFAPYNITFESGLPAGLIDFDTACPAPRVWDIAYAVYRFVPLSQSVYDPKDNRYRPYNRHTDAARCRQFLHAFLDAYGDIETSDVLEHVPLRLQTLVDLFDVRCNAGDAAFICMRNEGHQQLYRDEIRFIQIHKNEWQ